MKRFTILVGLSVVLSAPACDPAKTGYYRGDFPDPPSIDVPEDNHLSGIGMKMFHRRDFRRWRRDWGTTGIGGSAPGSNQLIGLWSGLGYALDCRSPEEALELASFGSLVVGTVSGAPDHVFVVNNTFLMDVRLFGPGGPVINRLEAGFHAYRRSCTSAEGNKLEAVAPNPKLTYDKAAATSEAAGVDPVLEACGLYVQPTFDLGIKIATTPISEDGMERSGVTDLAWSPASDAVYLLAGGLVYHDVEILRYDVGTQRLIQVGFGDYYAPLEVATGGTSLLVNRVGLVSDGVRNGSLHRWADRIRLPLANDGSLGQVRLPFGTDVRLGSSPMGILSPHGNTLAIYGRDNATDGYAQQVLHLVDVAGASLANLTLAECIPMAWDPTGTKLLVQSNDVLPTSLFVTLADASVAELPKDPAAPFFSPFFNPDMSFRDRVFWSATGPKVLMQSEAGAQVYDLPTFKTTTFVEPTLVAPPSAPMAVVVATEQVFA